MVINKLPFGPRDSSTGKMNSPKEGRKKQGISDLDITTGGDAGSQLTKPIYIYTTIGGNLMATHYFLEIVSFSLGNKISVTALTRSFIFLSKRFL